MRILTLALCAAAGLASAATAVAAPVTDVGYIQAAHCKGVADGSGKSSAALDTFIRKQGYVREEAVVVRAKEEVERGRHEAKNASDQAQAELSGVCAAWLSNPDTAGSSPR
jgi:hypothetical protein